MIKSVYLINYTLIHTIKELRAVKVSFVLNRYKYIDRYIYIGRQKDKQIYRYIYRQIDKQIERQIDKKNEYRDKLVER